MLKRPTYIDDYTSSPAFDGGTRLVYGTSGLGGVWGPVEERASIEALLFGFEEGISAVDTSPSYADAQKFLGQALKEWKGKQPYVSTKVGRLRSEDAHTTVTDYSDEGMKRSFYDSLETLGLGKVDLLFLHEPQLVPLSEIERILAKLHRFKEEGLTDRIGVGGNPTPGFMPYIKKENFEVVSGFLHLDACNLTALEKQIPLFQSEGIAYYAASALHFSLLGNRFPKYSQMEPDEWISSADQRAAIQVHDIATQHDMSLASLAQRYLFSIAEADRVVMGARTPAQIRATLSDWKLGKLPKDLFEVVTDAILASR